MTQCVITFSRIRSDQLRSIAHRVASEHRIYNKLAFNLDIFSKGNNTVIELDCDGGSVTIPVIVCTDSHRQNDSVLVPVARRSSIHTYSQVTMQYLPVWRAFPGKLSYAHT